MDTTIHRNIERGGLIEVADDNPAADEYANRKDLEVVTDEADAIDDQAGDAEDSDT